MQKITVTYEIEGYKHTVHTFVGSLEETDTLEAFAGGEMVEFLQSAKRLLTRRTLDEPNVCASCGTEHHELVSCPGTWVKSAHQ